MLLPRTPLDTLLRLCALRPFPVALLGVLWLVMLVSPPRLSLGALRLPVLVLARLLLSALWLSVLVLPRLLLSVLRLLLPLGGLTLLLSMLLFGLGLPLLALLLLGTILLFALLLVLGVSRGSDSKKQRQNGCAGNCYDLHKCYLQYWWDLTLALPDASRRRA